MNSWQLRAYSIRPVARQVIMPQAKCSMAMTVSGSFSQRTGIRRKRFIQLCVRSTPQRRALNPASFLMAPASSPRARICAVKPNSRTMARTSSSSYPLVQAQPPRTVFRGQRPFRHEVLQGAPDPLHVMTIGPVDHHRNRDTARLGQQAALDALFATIRRVRPRFFEPARGDFVIAPSIDSHDPSIPSSAS